MRRLLPLVALLATLPLGGGTASACAPPAEGEPQCCTQPPLVVVDTEYAYVAVPNPFVPPPYYCE